MSDLLVVLMLFLFPTGTAVAYGAWHWRALELRQKRTVRPVARRRHEPA